MHRSSLHLLLRIGAGLALVGCGDDGITTASGSDTGGATEAGSSSSTSPTTTVDPTTVDPTTGPDPSGMTEAMSSTDTPETTTEGSASSTGDTSTGDIADTTIGPDTTGDTTTGDTTTGDTTTDTTTGDPDTTTGNAEECPLAQQHKPCDAMSDDALHAMGLNCTSLGGDYVDNDNAVSVAMLDFQAPPAIGGKRAWQVARSYGTFVDPNTQKPFWNSREGDKVLMISSGLLPKPNAQGAIVIADGAVYNNSGNGGVWDSDSMPPPMKPDKGSPDPMGFKDCDGVNDCSNTIEAQWDLGDGDAEDKMWFSFKLTAPSIANGDIADANGYTFDFAYFSAEFPEFVDTGFNDIFVVWQSSENYTGNVTFINGQPLTVTALWPVDFQGECDFFDPNCQGADEHLQGTGHIDDGGATGWYKATGGVNPGETFGLAFAIFDMGDSDYDTTALLDNWQWDCEGCVPNEVESCGIEPQ